jgi:hypothetical protein
MTTPFVSWTFQRSLDLLTCAVDFDRDRASYDMRIVPYDDMSSSVVETFGSITEALQRHADVASRLRLAGWDVAGYSADVIETYIPE